MLSLADTARAQKNGFWRRKNLFLGERLCRPMNPPLSSLWPTHTRSNGLTRLEWRRRTWRHQPTTLEPSSGYWVCNGFVRASLWEFDSLTSVWGWDGCGCVLHTPFIIYTTSLMIAAEDRTLPSFLVLFLWYCSSEYSLESGVLEGLSLGDTASHPKIDFSVVKIRFLGSGCVAQWKHTRESKHSDDGRPS